jgi:peroxiredoxin (alkyl hydroperoxide reductase subunit C)
MSVLVGKKAPLFTAPAVVNGNEIISGFSLEKIIGKKNIILFFYPADFTFVCPTELLAFQEKLEEFIKRDTEVIGVSVDSEHSHWAWLQTTIENGGIDGVKYILVADSALTISKNYDVLAGDYEYNENDELVFQGTPQAYRGLFIIDKNGIVRHQTVNDMPLGRNVNETIRNLDALIFYEKYGEVCPANWQFGDKGIVPTREGICNYMSNRK